jgi:cyclophilin family peptidyl-prolyl cis-trans isomerase
MPRSRRYRKSQKQAKPEWGKNNPEAKAKRRKAMIIVVGILVVVAVLLAAFLVVDRSALFPQPSSSPSPSATPLTSPAGEYSANGTRVLLETSMGNITVQLRDDKPITTQNFVSLVKQGFYDGTVFHRVVAGFVIQGGQNDTVNVTSISDEIGNDNHNYNGTIAMAKTSQPNSATSQFFINVKNNNSTSSFDSTYTVFGQVIGGMNVVMNISEVPVTTNTQTGEKSQPVQPVTLIHAEVLP